MEKGGKAGWELMDALFWLFLFWEGDRKRDHLKEWGLLRGCWRFEKRWLSTKWSRDREREHTHRWTGQHSISRHHLRLVVQLAWLGVFLQQVQQHRCRPWTGKSEFNQGWGLTIKDVGMAWGEPGSWGCKQWGYNDGLWNPSWVIKKRVEAGWRIVGYRLVKNVSCKMKGGGQTVTLETETMEAVQLLVMIKSRACLQGLGERNSKVTHGKEIRHWEVRVFRGCLFIYKSTRNYYRNSIRNSNKDP